MLRGRRGIGKAFWLNNNTKSCLLSVTKNVEINVRIQQQFIQGQETKTSEEEFEDTFQGIRKCSAAYRIEMNGPDHPHSDSSLLKAKRGAV